MTKQVRDIVTFRLSRHDVGRLSGGTMSIFDWPALELEICQTLEDLKKSGDDCLRRATADLESRITALEASIVASTGSPWDIVGGRRRSMQTKAITKLDAGGEQI